MPMPPSISYLENSKPSVMSHIYVNVRISPVLSLRKAQQRRVGSRYFSCSFQIGW